MSPRWAALGATGLFSACAVALPQPVSSGPTSQQVFANSRDPPFYQQLDAATRARAALGHAVFNTQWVRAGTPLAGRRDGLGPLYNAASCDECHNEGLRGRGPVGDGPAPQALIVQLEVPTAFDQPAKGDPHYGHVLNTAALAGLEPEGRVSIQYREDTGRYPDGTEWHVRVPRYLFSALRYGPLSPATVLKPRLAPSLFGNGLLEAVPETAITDPYVATDGRGPGAPSVGAPAWQWVDGRRRLGRFGWQGTALSIRDQTTRAFSREMGLTSRDVDHDDCTAAETDCLAQPNGGSPEVADDLLDAVVEFQRWLAVPAPGAAVVAPSTDPLFVQVGCAACHRPSLPVMLQGPDGTSTRSAIAPYTDLRLHDLGPGLADTDAAGRKVPSLWRTAPLWGLGYRVQREHYPTFLHDGRGRSIEEAILWHDGEARAAREAFEHLTTPGRTVLMQWLAAL